MKQIDNNLREEQKEPLTINSKESVHLVFLEENFTHGILYGREIEERFSYDEGSTRMIDIKNFFAKNVIPHSLLHIPIDQIALHVMGEKYGILHTQQ